MRIIIKKTTSDGLVYTMTFIKNGREKISTHIPSSRLQRAFYESNAPYFADIQSQSEYFELDTEIITNNERKLAKELIRLNFQVDNPKLFGTQKERDFVEDWLYGVEGYIPNINKMQVQYPTVLEPAIVPLLIQYGELHNPFSLRSSDAAGLSTIEWIGAEHPSKADIPYFINFQSIVQSVLLIIDGYAIGLLEK